MQIATGPLRAPADEDDFDLKIRHLRRRRAASIGGYAMHQAHPEAARINGAKGGRARMQQLPNASAWMQWIARRRWWGELAGPAPSHVSHKGEPHP